MSLLNDLVFEAGIAARSLAEYFSGGALRLGVTGLSRAGKTVFITALINNLVARGRDCRGLLPASAEGASPARGWSRSRTMRCRASLGEDHLAALAGEGRRWPQSTRRISQTRLTIEIERAKGWGDRASTLTLDIVDYPGEWLLDLPLLGKSYAQWSRETIEASEGPARAALAADWLAFLGGLDPAAPAQEEEARKSAELFTAYLRKAREDVAFSIDAAARLLMPGDPRGFAGPNLRAARRRGSWALWRRRPRWRR